MKQIRNGSVLLRFSDRSRPCRYRVTKTRAEDVVSNVRTVVSGPRGPGLRYDRRNEASGHRKLVAELVVAEPEGLGAALRPVLWRAIKAICGVDGIGWESWPDTDVVNRLFAMNRPIRRSNPIIGASFV